MYINSKLNNTWKKSQNSLLLVQFRNNTNFAFTLDKPNEKIHQSEGVVVEISRIDQKLIISQPHHHSQELISRCVSIFIYFFQRRKLTLLLSQYCSLRNKSAHGQKLFMLFLNLLCVSLAETSCGLLLVSQRRCKASSTFCTINIFLSLRSNTICNQQNQTNISPEKLESRYKKEQKKTLKQLLTLKTISKISFMVESLVLYLIVVLRYDLIYTKIFNLSKPSISIAYKCCDANQKIEPIPMQQSGQLICFYQNVPLLTMSNYMSREISSTVQTHQTLTTMNVEKFLNHKIFFYYYDYQGSVYKIFILYLCAVSGNSENICEQTETFFNCIIVPV
ncbi:unnamed protein product (macronuclear) [Paramecium tetraurelia]|uniref:Transmembrane protein n=1 Tax=Paramecium tetraurelia TaxID=5888 RepID=A0BJV9_PARTE|nr:uncharacterized protein GSPATT00029456001 [Paramecium tetraurelia]CAK58826.1 unnamed protein product [Paramecium tetraurelia]|eukprot:XP_001426224.1 hypothetical protein (macronuclear) [Paramecium tetraurelia strain d4-2]